MAKRRAKKVVQTGATCTCGPGQLGYLILAIISGAFGLTFLIGTIVSQVRGASFWGAFWNYLVATVLIALAHGFKYKSCRGCGVHGGMC